MDDLPDKLRRNVVVLSAAIVAITVFHLSFRPTGTLLGFAEVSNVSPLKVWLALATVLSYVFLRYWFHDETNNERALLAQEFDNRRYTLITRQLQRTIERYLEHKRAPRYLTDFDYFAEEQLARFADRGSVKKATVAVSLDRDEHSPWRGGVRYALELEWASNHYRSGIGRCYQFQLPPPVAAWIIFRCALGTATYSKSAVDVLAPIGLAAIAAGMCLFQLVTAGMKA
ncbi:hypothetical protein BLA9940_06997 [Burkholderia aenigmatica]|uniref:hypothetical protein n=1 Tax=Burkholderia cepacia complex TaxID=87882 RepID=UPI000F07F1B2|nr:MULTISPECIES: hypothetical protein [Burkholderia cepacia complex]AYQ36678.1 hypothetical protein CVS37_00070 [Burkholderia lata]VWD13524.1 hypothetical protein BLA9940_06997 [Burkholderia aenigmatica]